MSDIETADAPLTAAELAKLNAGIAHQLHDRVPLDARPAPQPEGASAALFDDGIDPSSEAGRYRDPYIRLIVAHSEALSETLNDFGDAIRKLRRDNHELQIALAEMKVALVEVTAKANQTDLIVQRLQVDRQGPAGPQGPMGRDGRDGAQGPAGPRGNRGQKGWGIAAWEIDAANYRVTAALENGETAPPLNLRALFETYDAAVSDLEDRDIVSAAAESRARNEQEAEAAHWSR